MSLYDDIDTDKKSSDTVAGWASGVKFMQQKQQQLQQQLKKPSVTNLVPQPKRAEVRRQHIAPVADFKGRANAGRNDKKGDIVTTPSFILPYSTTVSKKGRGGGLRSFTFVATDPDWQFENEYDPYFPNEYEKALKDLRERRDREAEEEEVKRLKEGDDGEDNNEYESDRGRDREKGGGVAIAPPPSLDYIDEGAEGLGFGKGGQGGKAGGAGAGGLDVAAKIMAKYGYKEGQGLGRMEQGMSTALLVEKTSHRIGRIIHEKDVPKEGVVNLMGASNLAASYMDDDEFEMAPPDLPDEPSATVDKTQQEQYVEHQLKNTSRVVLLNNMVGPGEVDDDLEPEVKEECQKFGEVVAVIVFQMPDVDSEDSIRIFIEFTQVASAVKAFMDLNGRFFGGRQVTASFYDPEKFNNLELTL